MNQRTSLPVPSSMTRTSVLLALLLPPMSGCGDECEFRLDCPVGEVCEDGECVRDPSADGDTDVDTDADTDTGTGTGTGTGIDPTDCTVGSVAWAGTLDGEEVSGSRTDYEGHVFINALGDNDGRVVVTFGSGRIEMTFPDLIGGGDSTPARGSIDFSGDGGPNVGNCETGEFSSTLQLGMDANSGTFVLRELRRPPYCEGAAVTGTLEGCYAYPD